METAMKDQKSELKFEQLILAAVRTTDNTPIYVDTQGFDAVSIYLQLGVGGITFDATNKIEFKLYEANAANGSDATPVAEADIIGAPDDAEATGIIRSLVAAHAAADDYWFGYRGSKRYVGLLADFSGTHGAGTAMAAAAVLGHPRNSPTA